jgi:hypothetical protein
MSKLIIKIHCESRLRVSFVLFCIDKWRMLKPFGSTSRANHEARLTEVNHATVQTCMTIVGSE